jgi:hypothetical protein
MRGNERRSFFQSLITASHLWLYYLPHFQSWSEKYARKSRTLCADFAALFSPQDAWAGNALRNLARTTLGSTTNPVLGVAAARKTQSGLSTVFNLPGLLHALQAPFTLSEEQSRGCSVGPFRRIADADFKEKQS